MTKEELIAGLKSIAARAEDANRDVDTHADHKEADQLLLEYIGDAEVVAAFDSIDKWYS